MASKCHKFNFLVIGDTMTGKSALVKRYTNGHFKEGDDSTIGIEYDSKAIVGHPKTEAEIRLALWDTAGQKIFKDLIRGYFNKSDGVVVVIDVTREGAIRSLKYWLNETNKLLKNRVPFIVVGNKIDLQKRAVSRNEMLKFVKEYNNMEYIETSALTGKNVVEAFESLVLRIIEEMNGFGMGGSDGDFQKLEMELRKNGASTCQCCIIS